MLTPSRSAAADAPAPGGDFFVATSGNDANAGTAQAPFATVARARQAVRQRIAAGLKADVSVVLGAGTYELAEPLVIGPEDSGTTEHSVIYAAAPGQVVVLSGGRSVRGWTKRPDGRWTAELDDVKTGSWRFRDLYRGEQHLARARFPAEGFIHLGSVSPDFQTAVIDREPPPGSLGGAELAIVENWLLARGTITAATKRQLTLAAPVGVLGRGGTVAQGGSPAFLENAPAFLAGNDDWCIDETSGELIFAPRVGEDPHLDSVIAPRLEQLLIVRGKAGAPAGNVQFRGITFAYTAWHIPPHGYAPIQAGHFNVNTGNPSQETVLPGAIELEWAGGCRIENCRVVHHGACGVCLGPGCQRDAIVGCEIADVGGNGAMIGWRGHERADGTMVSIDNEWTDPAETPVENEIADCNVHNCGVMDWGCIGIWAAFTRSSHIHHNWIHDLPYSGISVGFEWNPNPTSQRDCLVEYNRIEDVMKALADGGGIYTLGFQPGTTFRGNFIHDVQRSAFSVGGAPNNGFFIDEGSKGFSFEGNWVYRASGGPVRFNQNAENWHTWKDNHFLAQVDDDKFNDPALRAAEAAAGPREPYRAERK